MLLGGGGAAHLGTPAPSQEMGDYGVKDRAGPNRAVTSGLRDTQGDPSLILSPISQTHDVQASGELIF